MGCSLGVWNHGQYHIDMQWGLYSLTSCFSEEFEGLVVLDGY